MYQCKVSDEDFDKLLEVMEYLRLSYRDDITVTDMKAKINESNDCDLTIIDDVFESFDYIDEG